MWNHDMALSKHCQLAWALILGQSTALSPFVFDNGPIWSLQITLQFAIGCSLLGIYGMRYEFESLPAIPAIRQFMYSQRRNDICAGNAVWDTAQAVIDVSYSVKFSCSRVLSLLQHVKLKQTKLCQLRWVQLVPFHHKFLFKRVLDSNQSGSLFLRPSKVQWWRFSSQIKSLSKSVLPKVDSHPVLYGELIIHSNTTQFHLLQNLRLACSYHCASQNVLKCIETKCAGMRILLSSRSLQFAVADGCATARLGNGSSLLVFSSLLVVES